MRNVLLTLKLVDNNKNLACHLQLYKKHIINLIATNN